MDAQTNRGRKDTGIESLLKGILDGWKGKE